MVLASGLDCDCRASGAYADWFELDLVPTLGLVLEAMCEFGIVRGLELEMVSVVNFVMAASR